MNETIFSSRKGNPCKGCPIAGNIVVMKEGMTDDGPDIVGLTDGDIIWVKEIAIKSSGGFLIDLDTEEVKQNG